jgi:hypothetical protein
MEQGDERRRHFDTRMHGIASRRAASPVLLQWKQIAANVKTFQLGAF